MCLFREEVLLDGLGASEGVLGDDACDLAGVDLLLLHELLLERGELFGVFRVGGESLEEKDESIFAGSDVAELELDILLYILQMLVVFLRVPLHSNY